MMPATYQSIYAASAASNQQLLKERTMRVYKPRRLVLLLAIVVIGLMFAFSSIMYAWSDETDTSAQVDRVYVQSGDTLWGIAKSYIPVHSSIDIRDYIYKIKKHNGMKSSALVAGEIIEVPLIESR